MLERESVLLEDEQQVPRILGPVSQLLRSDRRIGAHEVGDVRRRQPSQVDADDGARGQVRELERAVAEHDGARPRSR